MYANPWDCAVGVIMSRNPINSVLFLILNIFYGISTLCNDECTVFSDRQYHCLCRCNYGIVFICYHA
jgi:hypothetical protein